MIVFCCVLPASNKAREDDDDGVIARGDCPHPVQYALHSKARRHSALNRKLCVSTACFVLTCKA